MDYKNRLGIDLHIHSTASDGSFTPAEIIDHAQRLNLAAIAITDHDSIYGSKEALRTGIPSSLKFLTGVEISAAHPPFFPGSGSFHILGYCIRLDNQALNQALNRLREARKNRNPKIIKRLNELGLEISMEDVNQTVDHGQLGRPHIAQVMIKKGFVESMDEAFDKFLGAGKPAYIDKDRIGCEETIKMIRGAGGVPVLAHPALLNITDDFQLEELIQNLIKIGMRGIEVYYPEHSPEQILRYRQLADKYNLLITGGTDFHGSITPKIEMGTGKGALFIPYKLYEELAGSGFKVSDRVREPR
ncbi:MAG: PHP domain-containing protein [Desulfobacterales bacterium]